MAVSLFGKEDPKNFARFTQSLFTMFQICTGDSWASGITRGLMEDPEKVEAVPAIFFVSYTLVRLYFYFAFCIIHAFVPLRNH